MIGVGDKEWMRFSQRETDPTCKDLRSLSYQERLDYCSQEFRNGCRLLSYYRIRDQ